MTGGMMLVEKIGSDILLCCRKSMLSKSEQTNSTGTFYRGNLRYESHHGERFARQSILVFQIVKMCVCVLATRVVVGCMVEWCDDGTSVTNGTMDVVKRRIMARRRVVSSFDVAITFLPVHVPVTMVPWKGNHVCEGPHVCALSTGPRHATLRLQLYRNRYQ